MRGIQATVAVIVLILIGVGLKAIFLSSPHANSQAAAGSMPGEISPHELHLNHPDMKNLPRQGAPQP